jgi:hypothetical protein
MAKKSKKHVKKVAVEKKTPRISMMEKQKKERQKLYWIISLVGVAILTVGIIIGSILGNKPAAPVSELENGHFAQADGYFEMDVPKGWMMEKALQDIAPYGMDKAQNPYVFRPANFQASQQNESGAVTVIPSPNNILCAVFTSSAKTDQIETYLTNQNVIDEKDIVKFVTESAPLVGRKLKNIYGWILGEKPEQKVMTGSYVVYAKTGDVTIYITAKYTDDNVKKEILASLESLKAPIPDIIDAYNDNLGIASIKCPEGWKVDISGDTLNLHIIPPGLGAMIYPKGTKTLHDMTAQEVNENLKKNQNSDSKPMGEVTSGLSIPTPLRDYIAIYSIEKGTDPSILDNSFNNGIIGFNLNKIDKPYSWILDTINKKGLSMANCPGKYFISDNPIQIMQVKPEKTLFGTIDGANGKLLIMAGWTNDGVRKIIIDALDNIKTNTDQTAK